MSFVSYFSYVNTAGKVTARSLMDVLTVVCTMVEEQEKKNEQYEANFKEIEQILQKLVEDKTSGDSEDAKEEIFYGTIEEGTKPIEVDVKALLETRPHYEFKCEECGKDIMTRIGLLSHQRSHKPKE